MTALLLSLKTLRREATDHAIAEGLDGGIEELAQAVQELGGGDLSRGSGLRRLADRVSALAGRFTVESPAGDGTRIRAAIPLR